MRGGNVAKRAEEIGSSTIGEYPNVFIPAQTATDCYDRLIDKLGILTADEVNLVMNAYLLIKEFPERLRLVKRMMQMPDTEDDQHFIMVTKPLHAISKAMHSSHVKAITPAVDALSAGTPAKAFLMPEDYDDA